MFKIKIKNLSPSKVLSLRLWPNPDQNQKEGTYHFFQIPWKPAL